MLLFPPIPIKGKYIAIFSLVMAIYLDTQGNVGHIAHLGGIITGYLLLKIWDVKANSYKI